MRPQWDENNIDELVWKYGGGVDLENASSVFTLLRTGPGADDYRTIETILTPELAAALDAGDYDALLDEVLDVIDEWNELQYEEGK